jgi:hypothetical protein
MTSRSEAKPKQLRQLEGDYQRALLARVAKVFPDVRFFRRNTGLIKLDDRVFRAGIAGQADLYVIGLGGWHGEVEVKRFGSLTPEQMHWRDWCRAWCVPWIVVKADVDEPAAATIDRWVVELGAWMKEAGR